VNRDAVVPDVSEIQMSAALAIVAMSGDATVVGREIEPR
jgi:hypothetical protein